MDNTLKEKLLSATSLEEVKCLVEGHSDLDPVKIYEESGMRRSKRSDLLDLNELDSVTGGADRSWTKDGSRPPANTTAGAAQTISAIASA